MKKHTFGEWTADNAGNETRTCAVCGKTETREAPSNGALVVVIAVVAVVAIAGAAVAVIVIKKKKAK